MDFGVYRYMTHCHKCGNSNKKDAKFCVGCGTKIKGEEVKRQKIRKSKKKKPLKKRSILIAIILLVVVVGVLIYISTATKTITCTTQEPYTIQESYEEQESYEVQVPYTVQVPYSHDLSYVIYSENYHKDLANGFDVYAFGDIQIYNTDYEGGYFTVTVTFETLTDGKTPRSLKKYINANSIETFNLAYDVDAFEDVNYYLDVDGPTVTRYREETRYKTETRYRTVTKQRDVTKYRDVEDNKVVNKFFGTC